MNMCLYESLRSWSMRFKLIRDVQLGVQSFLRESGMSLKYGCSRPAFAVILS